MRRALSFSVAVSFFLGASAVASDKWYGTVTFRYQQTEDNSETRETAGTTSTTEDHFTKDLTAVAHLNGGKEGAVFVRAYSLTTKSSKTVTPDSCHYTAPGLETANESGSISTVSGSTRKTFPNGWVEFEINEDGSYVIPL